MSHSTDDWMNQLSALPPEERAELAYQLLQSLDDEADPDWEEAWAAELQRRTDAIATGQATEEPAAKVIAELRRKYS